MPDNDRRTVVITGASSGIGRATARAFAAEGAALVLVARRQEALEDLAAECRTAGAEAVPMAADVTDESAADHAARVALDRFGRIDVWVNSAAVTLFSPFGEEPVADLRRVLDVNAVGTALASRAAIRRFREQGEGVLINLGSALSRLPISYQAGYVMSKHAVRGLTSALATELSDVSRIHVCSVLPASVDTPLYDHAANHTGRQPRAMRPVLSPERVARAVVACARRPRREVHVGWATRLGIAAYLAAPRLTRRSVRRLSRRHFLEWPAPATSGNLHQPLPGGAATRGGWRWGEDRLVRRLAVGGAMALLGLLAGRR